MKLKTPWEKLGLSETSYLLAYSAGYRHAYVKSRSPYARGSGQYKAYRKGKRDAKKI